jgi:hypothetical protein
MSSSAQGSIWTLSDEAGAAKRRTDPAYQRECVVSGEGGAVEEYGLDGCRILA